MLSHWFRSAINAFARAENVFPNTSGWVASPAAVARSSRLARSAARLFNNAQEEHNAVIAHSDGGFRHVVNFNLHCLLFNYFNFQCVASFLMIIKLLW